MRGVLLRLASEEASELGPRLVLVLMVLPLVLELALLPHRPHSLPPTSC